MSVVTCNWIPLLSSFSELQRLTISMQYRYTMEPLPARLHHHCLRNREWNKGSKRPRLWSFIKQQQTNMCPLSTSTFCVATIILLCQPPTLPNIELLQYIQWRSIYNIQFPPQVPWTKWRLKLVMSLLENYSRPRPGWRRAGGGRSRGRGGGRSRPWRSQTCCQRGTSPPRPAPPPTIRYHHYHIYY